MHADLLVVHTYILRLSSGMAGQFVLYTRTHVQCPLNKYLSTQPVLDPANRLFFIFQYTECIDLDMGTGALVQHFT